MLKLTLSFLMVLLYSNTLYADIEEGKQVFNDSNCLECHSTDKFKYRVNKVNSFEKLHGTVSACANNSNAGLFEEEIKNVSLYLNKEYYHFKVKEVATEE